MSEVKHTPGPWTITVYPPDDYGAEDLCAYIDGNRKHVAHCMPPEGTSKELRDANARLISAAPEMLEALKLIANAENSALDLAYCKGIARAAITKAGEKS